MKLLPPLKDVDLYKQGFGDEDLLNRSGAGKRLSELLERIEDPLVVALHGPWGSGKSFFLQRWVGAHNTQNGGSATTVYFDAFAHDYLEDPLIALTGAIGERLGKKAKKGVWQKAKTLAYRVAKPALRIGLAAGTAGLSEMTNPVVDATLDASAQSVEDAADEFWRREDGRRAAMASFRSCLEELTNAEANGGTQGTLIVVIDELDRCRPDYALSILEVVKHFFSVPRVHFVLGANLTALEQSVKSRYGNEIDARSYLKRFVSLEMHLPSEVDDQRARSASGEYFKSSADSMGLESQIVEEMYHHVRLAGRAANVTLRDIEKILMRLALLPRRKSFARQLHGWNSMICSTILLQVMHPDLLSAALKGNADPSMIKNFYGFTDEMLGLGKNNGERYDHQANVISLYWRYCLSNGADPADERSSIASQFDQFGAVRASSILANIERDFLSYFELIEE